MSGAIGKFVGSMQHIEGVLANHWIFSPQILTPNLKITLKLMESSIGILKLEVFNGMTNHAKFRAMVVMRSHR